MNLQPISTEPSNHLTRLYLCNGRIVQGFRDITWNRWVQHEFGNRMMRRQPTHWAPMPELPR